MNRLERDSFGDIEVPSEALWGAQTQRSLHHFAISTERMPVEMIHALTLVKRACATGNRELGLLDARKADAIIAAADEVLAGKHADAFPLSVWQTGSGTQTNMNMNEVLANRASELLGGEQVGRAAIETKIPHRGRMLLLDAVLWASPEFDRGVGVHHVGEDEFWVHEHFPGDPMMPGVLMVELGGQLACFLHNSRLPEPQRPALVRIDQTAFRTAVRPGDDLHVLCREVRWTPKRFISDVQGVVRGRVAFASRLAGVQL